MNLVFIAILPEVNDTGDGYNGQEYDWVFIDEATQFSERAFNFLGGLFPI